MILDSIYAIALSLENIINDCSAGIETSIDCNAVTGVDVLNQIRQLTIDRALGPISIPVNSPVNPSISYLQYVGVPKEIIIGSYQSGTATINYSALQFRDGSTIPVSAIIPEAISFNDIGAVIIAIVVMALMVVCLVLIGMIWYFKEKPPIKKSSPLFCTLILSGVILSLGSTISRTLYPTRFTCVLTYWLFFIGFSLILGSIFAKTYRIFRIFSNARLSTSVIQDKDLLLFSGGIFLVFSTCLIVASIASTDVPAIVASRTDPLLTFLVCNSKYSSTVNICLLLSFACIFVLLLLLAIIAYLTRNVDSAFNESIYIAITVYSYVALFIIVVPLYIVSADYKSSERSRYFESAIAVILAMLVTLAALFIPKFYIIYKEIAQTMNRSPISSIVLDPAAISLDSLITDLESEFESDHGRLCKGSESFFLTRSLWTDQDFM